jgi:hypothetical protein
MSAIVYNEKNVIHAFEALFDTLDYANKKALVDYLSKSLKKERKSKEKDFNRLYGSWKSDKSAEEIIDEIRLSRSSGNTRNIIDLD